ncbi:MAG: PadR family transcriptional regulator [Anaerolineae bacterium]|nr:PadR family transcriptional regulator [Anaerolineae bacterium]
MEIRYVVLGLLSQQSMTGYAIKAMFDHLSWLVDSPSYGSLYPVLHTLLELEWVSVEIVLNEGKPPRKIYSITEKGHQALLEWSNETVMPRFSTKSFIMGLMLANNLPQDVMQTYLTLRQQQLTEYLSEDKQFRQSNGTVQNLGQYLVTDYGVTLARAELAWLECKLAQLEQDTITYGGVDRSSASG